MWIRTSSGKGLFNPDAGVMISARCSMLKDKEKIAVISVSAEGLHTEDVYGFGLGKFEVRVKGDRVDDMWKDAEGICKKVISVLWEFLKEGKDFDMEDVFKMVLKEVRA
ncbi:hypothetical protein MFS40622_1112 [Methanocaldococcus sp. FS406-22]|uniref:hypothetical protein n=1 Tax=Methanocaldococcus sp. (strain FS406-22) TaxID=644281 RepID=UPI0001BF3510|nr:hypothetical protein [Methanocaldococcus sp. FS406-22]ADC69792.1 hypothetical protein MFS40622_1112 [Methanocaldococcus sp. FS406-22]